MFRDDVFCAVPKIGEGNKIDCDLSWNFSYVGLVCATTGRMTDSLKESRWKGKCHDKQYG